MAAAYAHLDRPDKERGHLLGVAVMTLGYTAEVLPGTRWHGNNSTDVSLVSSTNIHLRPNPRYTGTFEFREVPLWVPQQP